MINNNTIIANVNLPDVAPNGITSSVIEFHRRDSGHNVVNKDEANRQGTQEKIIPNNRLVNQLLKQCDQCKKIKESYELITLKEGDQFEYNGRKYQIFRDERSDLAVKNIKEEKKATLATRFKQLFSSKKTIALKNDLAVNKDLAAIKAVLLEGYQKVYRVQLDDTLLVRAEVENGKWKVPAHKDSAQYGALKYVKCQVMKQGEPCYEDVPVYFNEKLIKLLADQKADGAQVEFKSLHGWFEPDINAVLSEYALEADDFYNPEYTKKLDASTEKLGNVVKNGKNKKRVKIVVDFRQPPMAVPKQAHTV